jgi:L-amino acid N-acyltransferase YncA
MSELVKRQADAGDIPAIAAIYDDYVVNTAATFEVVPPDEAEMLRRMSALILGDYPYFVIERDNRTLGFGFAGPYRQQPAYRNTVEDSIYLAPDARGQGIGGLLLRSLLEESAARGFRQMIAIIGGSEDVASIRLHKAAGFAEAGTLKDVGFRQGWFSTVIMHRAIGPGSGSEPNR